MTRLLILTLIIALNCTQNEDKFHRFIRSFPSTQDELIYFPKISQLTNPMTKSESIDFVYSGDSSRIFCTERIFNLETEKDEGEITSKRFPNKCFSKDFSEYSLFSYSYFTCKSKFDLVDISVVLVTLDNDLKPIDTLTAYNGNDYFERVTGVMNVGTEKIFLLASVDEKSPFTASIISVDPKSKKFVTLKHLDNVKVDTDDYLKLMEKMDWIQLFNAK